MRAGAIGAPRLVYAELDDGMIHKVDYRNWVSRVGKPWPAHGEFETGCTFEHAGYVLTILCAMFGPARRVTAFSALLVADKQTDAAAAASGAGFFRRPAGIRWRDRRPASPIRWSRPMTTACG